MSAPNTNVSVRLTGDRLDPDEITTLLRCEPVFAIRKGDERVTGAFVRKALTGVWSFELRDDKTRDFSAQVRSTLDRLSDNFDVWRRLSTQFRIELFVGVFLSDVNQGFCLSPEIVHELSVRNLQVGFDVYCSGRTDTVSHANSGSMPEPGPQ